MAEFGDQTTLLSLEAKSILSQSLGQSVSQQRRRQCQWTRGLGTEDSQEERSQLLSGSAGLYCVPACVHSECIVSLALLLLLLSVSIRCRASAPPPNRL